MGKTEVLESKKELLIEASKGMSSLWRAMQDIHKTFGTPAPDNPTAQNLFYSTRRAGWTIEEAVELIRAQENLVDQVDAYLDIIVFALGGLVETGVDPGYLMHLVLHSQYDKLWDDGLPRVRESDGKWIKPDNWVAPEPLMELEIERQIKRK